MSKCRWIIWYENWVYNELIFGFWRKIRKWEAVYVRLTNTRCQYSNTLGTRLCVYVRISSVTPHSVIYDPIIPPLSHTQPQTSTLTCKGQSLNWIVPSYNNKRLRPNTNQIITYVFCKLISGKLSRDTEIIGFQKLIGE